MTALSSGAADTSFTVSEIQTYFDKNEALWTPSIRMMMDMTAGTPELRDEALVKLYADLPPAKKPKHVKKTEAERAAEITARRLERSIKEQTALIGKVMERMNAPFESESEAMITDKWILESFDVVENDELLAGLFDSVKSFRKRAANDALYKVFVKGKRGGGSVTALDSKRERTEEDLMDGKRCGYTGETVKAALKKNKGGVVDYNVITTKHLLARGPDRTAGGAVMLDEGEVVMWDMTAAGGVKQVKMRKDGVSDCRYPISSIREGGCECATPWGASGAIYKQNHVGVYVNVEKDWGCIPCNIKVVEGTKMCKRHHNAKKDLSVWTRDMLKVSDEKISDQDYADHLSGITGRAKGRER